jgi:hypothetical protein
MSTGYGKVQRKVIIALREHAAGHADAAKGMPLVDIVGHVYGRLMWGRLSWYERGEVTAVRRALRGLVADEVVVDLGEFFGCRRFLIHYACRP